MRILVNVLVLAVVLWASSLFATPYYLDHALGNDVNLGTSAGAGNAWKTIGKALDTVVADDYVWVKNGEDYIEDHNAASAVGEISTAGGATTPIIFEGYAVTPGDGGVAVLNAGTNALGNVLETDGVVGASLYYSFKNLRFTGASADGVHMRIPNYKFCKWTNCRFDNNGVNGLDTDADHVVVGCQFDNNGAAGWDGDGRSICVNSSSFGNTTSGFLPGSSCFFAYCLVYSNGSPGISTAGQESVVVNCTFDGENTDSGISCGSGAFAVLNSIFYDCDTGLAGAAGYEWHKVSLGNLFNSNDADRVNWPADASDVTGAPTFVNEAGDDYTLDTGSAAINAGYDLGFILNAVSYIDIGAIQKQITGGGGASIFLPWTWRHGQ